MQNLHSVLIINKYNDGKLFTTKPGGILHFYKCQNSTNFLVHP